MSMISGTQHSPSFLWCDKKKSRPLNVMVGS